MRILNRFLPITLLMLMALWVGSSTSVAQEKTSDLTHDLLIADTSFIPLNSSMSERKLHLATLDCAPQPLTVDFAYQALFDCTLGDLQERYPVREMWGDQFVINWTGDLSNDATAFGPELLFRLYAETGDPQSYQDAMETVRYSFKYITDLFNGGQRIEEWNFESVVLGLNSLITCVEFGKPEDQQMCSALVTPVLFTLSTLFNGPDVEELFADWEFYQQSKTVIYSHLAEAEIRLFQAKGSKLIHLGHIARAKQLMAHMEERAQKNELGFYSSPEWDDVWATVGPMIAYARLYGLVKKPHYKEEFDALMNALETHRAVDITDPTGAYYSNSFLNRVFASGQVQCVDAFLEMYAATQDPFYLQKGESFINFARDYLYLPTLGEPIRDFWFSDLVREVPHLTHDLFESQPSQYVELSDIYCSGESFYMLDLLLKHRRLTAK